MAQIVFLDTNVILDYLENRNKDVRDIIAQLLLFHKNGSISLATSVFNVAELIDKQFQIQHMGSLLAEKLSYDEIIKFRGKKKEFRKASVKYKDKIEKKIRQLIFEHDIEILELTISDETEMSSYDELYTLIYKHQFSSQDALIIGTALLHKITYFLSNDDDIVQEINNHNLIDAYNLRNPTQLDDFRNTVLESLVGKLK